MSVFVLMAGGTGGHLFPAMALAQELRRRGHVVDLMTDHRVATYGGDFPAREVHIVPSATPSGANPLKAIGAGATILRGITAAWGKLRAIKPAAVIGFGGYPTFPPFLAAHMQGIPGILHEQNAVMGRANRALGRFADVIALSFAQTKFAERFRTTEVTGNPVRDRVRAVAGRAYEPVGEGGPVRLLVVGGSQGARIFSSLVPGAIAELPEAMRQRLHVVQQCRPENLDEVADAYRQMRVNVELAAFFDDLPERIAGCHLVICRAGASTVAELCVLGRPAILVPLPGALDADQKNNALVMDQAHAGWIAEQDTLSPLSLAQRLHGLIADPHRLSDAAAAARHLGQPEAVEKLADLAERLAGTDKTTMGTQS